MKLKIWSCRTWHMISIIVRYFLKQSMQNLNTVMICFCPLWIISLEAKAAFLNQCSVKNRVSRKTKIYHHLRSFNAIQLRLFPIRTYFALMWLVIKNKRISSNDVTKKCFQRFILTNNVVLWVGKKVKDC